MKQNRKLVTASLLMSLSILLLVIFQAYWLRNAFRDEYRRLRRETSMTLRFTTMQEQFKQFVKQHDTVRIESFVVDSSSNRKAVVTRFGDSPSQRNINIVMADSARPPGPPRMFAFDMDGKNADENYSSLQVDFPLADSAIELGVIEKNYKTALQQNGIVLSFSLAIVKGDTSKKRSGTEFRITRRSNDNGNIRVFNAQPHLIHASFENPVLYLLKRIQWPIVFALIMLAITTTSFVFLYRNLVQQQRLADMKSDLISNITHELKTPIATVSVAIEALKNFDAIHDAAKTRQYLDISAAELQRLNLLVDRVLKLSLFEQQQINLQMETVEIQQLISEVINSLQLQFEKHGALVNLNLNGKGFYTQADRMHMIGVFYNLLDNALKYSPVNPAIEISISKADNHLVVKVADNGIGIPEAYRQKVFEKFFRVPHGDTHNIKGYGLGLSYVCEVVKKHGGDIRVQAVAGGGSEFIVTLPLVNAQMIG